MSRPAEPRAASAPILLARPPSHRALYWLTIVIIFACGPMAAATLWVCGCPPSRVDLVLFGSLYAATVLGFSLGWHRMLAHRAFELRPVAKAVLLAIASMSGQGRASSFAIAHRVHHRFSDRPGDPHTPRDGWWHAHFTWFMRVFPDPASCERIADDPIVAHFERNWGQWTAVGVLVPTLIGGLAAAPGEWAWMGALNGFVWGGSFRIFCASQAIWAGASVAHTMGHRTFDTPDDSRNSLLLGLLTFGDGWHNNHHAAPRAANLGARWWQFDGPGLVLRLLDALGLVRSAHYYTRADWDRKAAQLRAAQDWERVRARLARRAQVSPQATPEPTPELERRIAS